MTHPRRCATGGCARIPRDGYARCPACVARLMAYAFGPGPRPRVERLFVKPEIEAAFAAKRGAG